MCEAKPWYRNVLLGPVTGKAPEEHLSTQLKLTKGNTKLAINWLDAVESTTENHPG